MPRIARLESAGFPYHVVQRGNRNQKVFLRQGDKTKYLDILNLQAKLYGIEVWAYCLMDNHVHLIVFPKLEGGLTECISEVHRQYTRMINFREGWHGFLWQGRYKSFPLDERYLIAAVRYVERNPVRAGLVKRPEEFVWSSAHAHIKGIHDPILSRFYLMDEITDWEAYLNAAEDSQKLEELRTHQKTGRPLGENEFIEKMEYVTGVVLKKKKRGRKNKVTVCVPH